MILYSKFSNERDSSFAIRTDIAEEMGVKHVRKYPQTPAAEGHVKRMKNAFDLLTKLCRGTRFVPNRLKELPDGGMEFEFLEGETLEEVMNRALEASPRSAANLMLDYLGEIDTAADTVFEETDNFRKVFGKTEGKLDGLKALSGADIDLVLSNIIVSGGAWNITDYEWTFEFPIPVNFVKWRTLFYYERDAGRLAAGGKNVFELCGIDESQQKIYKEMELSFQRYIEGRHVPIRNLYENISQGSFSFPEADKRLLHERAVRVAELFKDTGSGFLQESAKRIFPDDKGIFSFDISTDHLEALRIDPASAPCLVHISQLVTDKGSGLLRFVEGNGTFISENVLVYNGNDPQIVIREWPENSTVIHIEFSREIFYDFGENDPVAAWMTEDFGRTCFAGRMKAHAEIWRGDMCESVAITKWGYGNEEAEIRIDSSVTHVDIIPAESPCMLSLRDVSTDQGVIEISSLASNGIYLEDNIFFFDNDEPKISIGGWKAGSRLLNVSFMKQMVDRASAKAVGRRFESFRNLLDVARAENRDKVRIITERDGYLKNIEAMKPVRLLRKARKEMGRGDMFEPFRTIQPDAEHMIFNIEERKYGRNAFHVKGWCADRDFHTVDIRVLDSRGDLLNARIPRFTRADVAKNLKTDRNGMYGFEIAVPYREITAPPVYVEFSNPRGAMKEDLGYEPDPSKRKKENVSAREEYDSWYRRHRPDEAALKAEREYDFKAKHLFSIVVPLYRTPEKYLNELIESVRNQTYPNWELILSDGSGEDSPLTEVLDGWSSKDERIRPVHNNKQLRISENTNAAISKARGDFIVFCDHDDLLAPWALFENMKLLEKNPEAEAVYSDEDKLSAKGKYIQPNFKPDFDKDHLDATNYICHLLVVKKTLLDKVGLLNPAFDGAQDHDLVLRISEQAKFYHIPKILYHWRLSEESTAENPESKPYAFEAGCRAVKAHYDRIGIPANVKRTKYAGIYRTYYHWDRQPKVSIIIPNYEHPDLLKRCIDSIVEKCSYPNYEILVIENNSKNKETFDLYDYYRRTLPNFKLVTYNGPFNYSAINNFGVKETDGEYLLFLNNDTEFIGDSVLEELLYPCMRSDVGAVGARLYYEDGTIQHAGVIIGVLGVAANAFANFPGTSPGYMGRIAAASDLSCVTAACIMVKRKVFEEVQGFYEGLAVAFNDVDLCLKIRRAGYLIEYNPYAELYHYESKSRGQENTPEKQSRFEREIDLFMKRWPDILRDGDPYYNPNLTLKRSDFSLREDDEPHMGG